MSTLHDRVQNILHAHPDDGKATGTTHPTNSSHAASHSLVGKSIGPVGFGLMNFTWRPKVTPDEQAFAAMNKALELGANYFVTGEFYGDQGSDPQDGLFLINRYYSKYPEAAKKVVLSIKGGNDLKTLKPNGSPEGIRRSIDNILEKLEGKAKLDVYCISRVDTSTPLETTYKIVKEEYIDTGKIGGLCLSECSADTIRKAVQIVPVVCVEVEVSLWATEIFENGIAEVCREHNIPIIGYSPLGRGFLTGQLKSPDDIPEGDFRKMMDRFQPENFDKNLEIVEAVKKIGEKKGVSPSQLALAWVKQKGVIPIFGATKESQVVENMQEVNLTSEEMKSIDDILSSMRPVGGRYNKHMEGTLYQ